MQNHRKKLPMLQASENTPGLKNSTPHRLIRPNTLITLTQATSTHSSSDKPPTPRQNNHYQHLENNHHTHTAHQQQRYETGTAAAVSPHTHEHHSYQSLFTKYEEFEQPHKVVSISYSPNGEQLAVGDDSGTTVVYDLRENYDNNRSGGNRIANEG